MSAPRSRQSSRSEAPDLIYMSKVHLPHISYSIIELRSLSVVFIISGVPMSKPRRSSLWTTHHDNLEGVLFPLYEVTNSTANLHIQHPFPALTRCNLNFWQPAVAIAR